MSLLTHTPTFSDDQAKSLSTELFGIDVSRISPLPSERDQNFHIVDSEGQEFVLKISNATEERELLVAQNTMMQLASRGMESDSSKPAPRAIASRYGNDIEIASGNNDTKHLVRLVSYAPGTPLGKLKYHSPELMRKLGTTIGQLTQSLENFENESLNRTFHWDLAQAVNVVQQRNHLVEDEQFRETINLILARFQATTIPALQDCPQSILHNDANDGNVVVSKEGEISLIDYGDAVFGWTIGDLAIAIAYAILEKPDPLKTANEIVAGYIQVRPISPSELTALFGLICIRLCVSAVMAAEQQTARPDDPYLSISQKPIRVTLPLLAAIPFEFAESTFRATARLDPNPHSKRITDWLSLSDQKYEFPIHGISRDSTKFHVLDLSVSSQLLFGDQETLPQSELAVAIDSAIHANQSDIGVGCYLEPRLIYNSEMFAAHTLEAENRTIHLGMDLFVAAGSKECAEKICAPIQGNVEVVSNNTQPLDYGGLVVLRHETPTGDSFYSLYGHLSPTSIEQLEIGQTIKSGEVFADLGDPSENGGWPPHLHFQLITSMLGLGSDYVGVCTATWKTRWSDFCPNPNLVLNIPPNYFPTEKPDCDSTLVSRQERTSSNLSLSYRKPLKIVRGWKNYLYDSDGRKYIDAYNNVPHVGHCHPEVVKRMAAQLQLLNTNTRYLSDVFNELTDRLTATMPDPLNVCMLVNSASEANELALRMARAKTGHRDLIVLEGAYHGHTTTLIDISPYKHDGPGGEGAPDWVHTAPVADIFRGKFKDPTTAGADYAASVGDIIAKLDSDSRGLSGFIAESCPSVGGQILFPDGYLADVYNRVRAAGGVCIADDVQTGYGRLGSVFYGFELQNVVPDIVILGKPIGNGHPLAALVTTREIADAFANGMEYFSTFGGNTVSCAAGLAVLDVLEEEGLQQNALTVGQYLLDGLRKLQQSHPIIGDVRGSGFFLGLELVRDAATLEPAAEEASFISNRMRDQGILLGTDGPLHNVIKIRPPMTFSKEDADVLLKALTVAIASCPIKQ